LVKTADLQELVKELITVKSWFPKTNYTGEGILFEYLWLHKKSFPATGIIDYS
jgi:hypothetical protein